MTFAVSLCCREGKALISRIFRVPLLPRRFNTVIIESKEIRFGGIYDLTVGRNKISSPLEGCPLQIVISTMMMYGKNFYSCDMAQH